MLFSAYLFAVSLSIDALGIGITYGMRNIGIPLATKIIISIQSFLITSVALFLGKGLANLFPVAVAKGIGVTILIALGFWVLWQSLYKKEETEPKAKPAIWQFFIKSMGITIQIIHTPGACDRDCSLQIEPKEALYLGFALSIDSFGAGIGGGAIGLASPFTPIFVAIFQALFLSFGKAVGGRLRKVSSLPENTWGACSGILLILLGILRLF